MSSQLSFCSLSHSKISVMYFSQFLTKMGMSMGHVPKILENPWCYYFVCHMIHQNKMYKIMYNTLIVTIRVKFKEDRLNNIVVDDIIIRDVNQHSDQPSSNCNENTNMKYNKQNILHSDCNQSCVVSSFNLQNIENIFVLHCTKQNDQRAHIA